MQDQRVDKVICLGCRKLKKELDLESRKNPNSIVALGHKIGIFSCRDCITRIYGNQSLKKSEWKQLSVLIRSGVFHDAIMSGSDIQFNLPNLRGYFPRITIERKENER